MINVFTNKLFFVISSDIEIGKLFHTSFDKLIKCESFKMTNNLTNNIVKYRMTLIVNVESIDFSSNNFESYIYNITVDLKYNFFEFRELFVNTKTVARSTNNIDQFRIFQPIDDLIVFDKTTIDSINFIFDLGSITSIEIVTIKTSINLIVFYIVQVSMSFFFVSLI